MSDRDPVRELALNIASDCRRMRLHSSNTVREWIEGRIRVYLDERKEEQRKALRAAAGDVVEIFLDARPPGTVDLVYTKLVRRLGLEDSDGS